MKRFILHVGFHKTATSSIQQTLADNQAKLKTLGFHYPIFEIDNRRIVNHSIPFYSAYCEHPEKYNINVMNGDWARMEEVNDHYLQQIDDLMLLDENIIISGEDISILPMKALVSIRDKILSSGFNLEVYCSVRKPYSFLCSELQERIKAGVSTLNNITVPKKSACITKLKDAFGEHISFSSFEADCAINDPIVVFIERLGINSSLLSLSSNNEGLGNITTRLYAHLNETHPIVINGKINEKGRVRFLNNFDNEKFFLTKSEYQKIEKELAEESNKINSLLDDGYVDKEIKFADDFKIPKQLAEKIYQDIKQGGRLSLPILRFINRNRDFELIELLSSDDIDLLRDVGVLLKSSDCNMAIKFLEKASYLRPKGPKIKSELYLLKKNRTKLVAIAKDEGAYIGEWIFHHLYFGFDAIDIYVNNTSDNTRKIIQQISQIYPQVTLKNGDPFFNVNSKNPQIDVYRKSISEIDEEFFTHIMFLDIDEFFLSKDMQSNINDVISAIDSDVINFEWLIRVKETEQFGSPLDNIIYGNYNRHVKSLIKLKNIKNLEYDLSAHNIISNKLTYKLADSSIFEIDETLNKINAYSLIPEHTFFKELKPFFVVHRMFRSEMEYVSLLGRGRPNKNVRLKDNRQGYCLDKYDCVINLPKETVTVYQNELLSFIERCHLQQNLINAKKFIHQRFEDVIDIINSPNESEVKVIAKITKNTTLLR